jgi:hypothetical protein
MTTKWWRSYWTVSSTLSSPERIYRTSQLKRILGRKFLQGIPNLLLNNLVRQLYRYTSIPMEAAIPTNGGSHPYQWRRPSVPMEAAIRTNEGGYQYQWRRPYVPIEAAIRTNGSGHMYQWRRPKTYSSARPDGIGPQLLLEIIEEVAPALAIIYSQSWALELYLKTGVIPMWHQYSRKGKKTDLFQCNSTRQWVCTGLPSMFYPLHWSFYLCFLASLFCIIPQTSLALVKKIHKIKLIFWNNISCTLIK